MWQEFTCHQIFALNLFCFKTSDSRTLWRANEFPSKTRLQLYLKLILFQDMQYQEEFFLRGIREMLHHLLKRGSFGLQG